MNEIYLYGGHIQMLIIYEDGQVVLQRRTMYGAEDRINIEGLHDKVRLYNINIPIPKNKKTFKDFLVLIRFVVR